MESGKLNRWFASHATSRLTALYITLLLLLILRPIASSAMATGEAGSHLRLADRVLDTLTGSTLQSTVELKKGRLVSDQQASLRLALPGWSLYLDANLSSERDPKVAIRGVRAFESGQIDVGAIVESTPFTLVVPRSGVAGLRTRFRGSLLSSSYSNDLPWFLPRLGSPYARLNWLVGQAEGQFFSVGWFYEPRWSLGLLVPGSHNELLLCTLNQFPKSSGSLQTATRLGGDAGAERFAYQLKVRLDTALGTTNLEAARVPLNFSGFVAGLGERYHGWTFRRVSHSRKQPFELTLSWSSRLQDPGEFLSGPQELLEEAQIELGTPDYSKADMSISFADRDFVDAEDGEGSEFAVAANAAVDYLWDYDPCRASLFVSYRDRASISLPGYPGGNGWFEKTRTRWEASGSFGISTFFGRLTFSARRLDTYTTRFEEKDLRFTSYSTITDQFAVVWDCIPIPPWTAVNFSLGLKNYSRTIQSCTGGRLGSIGAGELSHSLEAYKSVIGSASSTVALPSERYTNTLTFSGTVELRREWGSDIFEPTFTGKVVYRLEL